MRFKISRYHVGTLLCGGPHVVPRKVSRAVQAITQVTGPHLQRSSIGFSNIHDGMLLLHNKPSQGPHFPMMQGRIPADRVLVNREKVAFAIKKSRRARESS